MADEVEDPLNGKILCGDANAGPILITGIDFVPREMKDVAEPVYFLQLSGEAYGYLIHNKNPDKGAIAFKEPMAVAIEVNTEKDAVVTLSTLSKALGLNGKDALDGEDPAWLERFDETNSKSVVELLRNKGIYIKSTLKKNWEAAQKFGDSKYYFNPFAIPSREAVSTDKIAEIKARILAKSGGGDALAGIG